MNAHMVRVVLAISLMLASASLYAGHAETRIALVIGNSSYKHAPKLSNPENDARLIAGVLTAAGISVDLKLNLGVAEMRRAIGDLAERAGTVDQVIVFFAGHGIEVEGKNYLIPVDAKLLRDFDIEDEAISMTRVLRAAQPARRLRLILLDACRDNPFTMTMKRTASSRSIGRGLAKVEPTVSDSLIGFATEAGAIATDGDGVNSPFALALSKHLTTPGLDLRIAFGRVRDEVSKTTGNLQRPTLYGSLGGEIATLVSETSTTALTQPDQSVQQLRTQPDPCASAQVHWQSAQTIGTKSALEDHIKRFPNCDFVGLAKAQLETLAMRSAVELPPVTQPTNRYHFLVGLDPAGDNWLALRSEPSTRSGKRLMKMGPETLLTVLDRHGQWLKVQLRSGELGWAHSKYIACCREVP